MAARNAASVLPEPVGAAISTLRPAWISGHARSCGVGRFGEVLGEPLLDGGVEAGGLFHCGRTEVLKIRAGTRCSIRLTFCAGAG